MNFANHKNFIYIKLLFHRFILLLINNFRLLIYNLIIAIVGDRKKQLSSNFIFY